MQLSEGISVHLAVLKELLKSLLEQTMILEISHL